MTKIELNEELQSVNKKIAALRERQKEINQKLLDLETDFGDKFRVWWERDIEYKEHSSCIPYKLGELRNWIDKEDISYTYHRYEIISIEMLMEDYFYPLLDPVQYKKDCKRGYIKALDEDELETMELIAQELMESNLKSFQYDW